MELRKSCWLNGIIEGRGGNKNEGEGHSTSISVMKNYTIIVSFANAFERDIGLKASTSFCVGFFNLIFQQ